MEQKKQVEQELHLQNEYVLNSVLLKVTLQSGKQSNKLKIEKDWKGTVCSWGEFHWVVPDLAEFVFPSLVVVPQYFALLAFFNAL